MKPTSKPTITPKTPTSRDRKGVVPSQPTHSTKSTQHNNNPTNTQNTKPLHPLDGQAHFLTFTTYGSWLHGDIRGSVDKLHNIPGTPVIIGDPDREQREFESLKHAPFLINQQHRACICKTIQEVADHRGWHLLALNVRSNHVHVVVIADKEPQRIMIDFKAYSTLRMTQAGLIAPDTNVWTRSGSTRYLNSLETTQAAMEYVNDQQGPALAGSIPLTPSKLNSPARRPRHYRPTGFTIVEVVVAMGVVLILLYIISILFTQVSKASDMILVNYAVSSYNTALGAQLRDDIRKINKDGIMVIRNQAIIDPATGIWSNQDQIAFLTSSQANSQLYGLQWVQPDGTTGGDSGLQRTFSTLDARVWYGHAAVGTTSMGYGANDPIGYHATTDSRLWALGRQQLLLASKFVSLETGASPTQFKTPADNAWFNKMAFQAGYPTTNYFGAPTRTLYPFIDGRTDIVADPVTASPDAIRSAILTGDIDPSSATTEVPNIDFNLWPWTPPLYTGTPDWVTLANMNVASAVGLPYRRMEGLVFRPFADRKLPVDANLSTDFLRTQLIIAPYCSNFKVEFAGDYTNNQSPIATKTTDGRVDILKTIGPGATGGPNGDYTAETAPFTIYWYGGGFDGPTAPAPARNIVQPATSATYGDGANNPLLNTRINTGSTIPGGVQYDLYTACFGYDKTATPWPRLLKITANLHDDKGRLRETFNASKDSTGQTVPVTDGKQFQFIIEVPQ